MAEKKKGPSTSERATAAAGPRPATGTPSGIAKPAKGLNVGNVGLRSQPTGVAVQDTEDRPPLGVRAPGFRPPVGGGEGGNILDFSDPAARELRYPGIRYFEGDDLRPASYAPEFRRQIQRELEEAGLLDPGTYQPETWDEKTRAAYRAALSLANVSGRTYEQIIQELKDNVARFGRAADTKARAPLFVTLTNPTDVSNVAQAVASRVSGRRLTDEQLQFLTSAYHQMERAYQQQRYTAMGSGGEGGPGGENYGPPNLTAFAEEQAKQLNPEGAAEMRAIHSMEVFEELLDSSRSRLSALANPVQA